MVKSAHRTGLHENNVLDVAWHALCKSSSGSLLCCDAERGEKYEHTIENLAWCYQGD